MRWLLVIGVIALMCPAYAWADGFEGYTDTPVKKADVGVPAGFVNTPAATVRVEEQPDPESDGRASTVVSEDTPAPEPVQGEPGKPGSKGDPGAKGDKGDKGDRGDTGPQGIQGIQGVNADLCQNLPGVQTVPGSKYNAQRYWGFLPKWEKRYLAVNRKRQIVCVTLRWIRVHS